MSNQLGLDEATPSPNPEPRIATIYLRDEEHPNWDDIDDAVSYAVENLKYTKYDYSDLLESTSDLPKAVGDYNSEAILVFFDRRIGALEELETLLRTIQEKQNPPRDFIVPRLRTLGKCWRDVSDAISTINKNDVTVHCFRDSITVDPDDDSARRIIEAVADSERRNAAISFNRSLQVGDGTGGRPPIGFTGDGRGGLRPAANFDEVRSALLKVDRGEMTPYRAAQITGHSRSAIRAAIEERRELYNLDNNNKDPKSTEF